MAPRLARSSVQASTQKNARTKHKKRNLDAYAIASHTAGSDVRVPKNRLGEYLDDAPKQKRRRIVKDQDDSEESADEDIPAGTKRKRTVNDDSADGDEGSDSEGNEWRLGGLRSDDDDSELDSDEAFGESDEEKFEGFTFRGSKSGNGKAKTKKAVSSRSARPEDHVGSMDLVEDIEEEENEGDDGFGDEGVDLATMLDDDDQAIDEEDMGEDESGDERDEVDEADFEALDQAEENSGSEEDGEDEVADQEAYEDSEEDSDQYDEERAARTRDHVEALDSKRDQPIARSKVETLSIDDLAATFDTATRKEYEAAKRARTTSGLQNATSVPLPKRQQDRLNREVATQKAKEQLDRWRDTVVQNRRAEFLSFPLKHNDEGEPIGKDKFIVDGKPQNELEESIQRIMQESGLSVANGQSRPGGDEAGILQAEDLAINKLPIEDVMRRRAELRRTRDLLFREERKAKRIAKIKSKSYRRVHRKERERQAQLEDEMMGSGDEEEKRETNDRKRAMARMSTKHRDSKFAKALKETNRGVWDEDAREAVLDEARRRDELERRIRGKHVRDEDDESDVDSEEEGSASFEGFDGDQDLASSRDMSGLYSKNGKGGSQQEEKGLQGLKFMQSADERRRAQNDQDIERLRKELAIQDGDEAGSDQDDVDDQGLGRAVFGPKGRNRVVKQVERAEMDEGMESEVDAGSGDEDVAIVTEKSLKNGGSTQGSKKVTGRRSDCGPSHDRRDPGSFLNGQTRAVSSWITGGVSDQQGEKSEWRMAKTDRSKVANAEPINVDISGAQTGEHTDPLQKGAQMLAHVMEGSNPNALTKGTNVSKNAAPQHPSSRKGIGHNSHSVDKTKEYHARAFASDDTAADFAAEKSALAQDEEEKEESSLLPGWGSWTGAGLSKSLRRANARQRHNPLYKTKTPGVAQANRKDAKLENVIISEKTDRKGKGYLAPILPHGFETKEQYERSLRLPVGPEWSTKEVFQQGTRPRVVVKPGTVIEAMERPMV